MRDSIGVIIEMKEIVFSNDGYHMNWLRPDYPYAKVDCPPDLSIRADTLQDGDLFYTDIRITNQSHKPFFTTAEQIGIYFPLEDKYESSDICIHYRCNTHIFCGGNISYIMALRMGGEAPHLGMVLTEGSLAAYSIDRDPKKGSNDRGCFILHPSPMELAPGESKDLRWTIFSHAGKDDFESQLGKYAKYVRVEAERYVLYPGEQNCLYITPSFKAHSVQVDGKTLAQDGRGTYLFEYTAAALGESVFSVCVDNVHTFCRTFVQEEPGKLADARCRFIARRQQYEGEYPGLKGAYLVYDNEETHIFYNRQNDFNGGRERVGMGLLLAAYLQIKKKGGPDAALSRPDEEDDVLESSLQRYVAYVEREIVDTETGEVCNDMGRDNSYKRLYNAPWFATLFVECYRLYGSVEFLAYACRTLKRFYRDGGIDFYPIEVPVLSLDSALQKEKMENERLELREWFIRHAKNIARRGLHYPASEVNYEQSIVAPAADILLQVYLLTKEPEYLEAGKEQLRVLEQFNGRQPDYHLHETAIRHWDGYWFGKRRQYGDTFPHYWSALTGNVYALYACITKDKRYARRAQDSLRGVLPLFFADGSASCAYVFPLHVNGARAKFYDPYANDQDWGLYFNLRMIRDLPEVVNVP